RDACPDLLSLVAVLRDRVVGHMLFSPVALECREGPLMGMGLAPMAVLPRHQRKGIGSKLVERGLHFLKQRSCPFLIVLGHPTYYPRFGFAPASRHGIRSQWDGVPDEAFMVLILDEPRMRRASGVARYRPEFNEAT
ncbi:MAG: N-acetyltransferase, partial [Planctomycetota bacterium]